MAPRWRVDEITKRVRGFTLHVGCVDDPERIGVEEWLHPRLLGQGVVVGVDFSLSGLEEMERRDVAGAGLVCGDAMRLPFRSGTFETVVASEIIEHVGNPEAMMSECARVLAPGGTLIVTTPNPFCIPWIVKGRKGPEATWNPQHVAWFDGRTLANLGERAAGLKLAEFEWVETRDPDLGLAPARYRSYVRTKPVARALLPRWIVSEGFLATFSK